MSSTQSAAALDPAAHIVGCGGSSAAYLVARSQDPSRTTPTVILARGDEEAATFAADLRSFLAALQVDAEVLEFPSFERSPYFGTLTAELPLPLARLKTLASLAYDAGSGGTVPRRRTAPFIVTSPAGFSLATLHPSEFAAKSFTLEPGFDFGSRDRLVELLTQAGYRQTEIVEDPGSFSVRGEIVDLFPPDRTTPIRIELFDSSVERVRPFDPETQRVADGDGSRIVVIPARETILDGSSAPRLRENLKTHADDRGVPRPVRDPVLAQIAPFMTPIFLPAWSAFVHERPASLADHLPTGSRLVFLDSEGIENTWGELLAEQDRLHMAAIEAHDPAALLPPPRDLFRWEQTRGALQKRFEKLVRIEPLAILDEKSSEPTTRVELAAGLWSPEDPVPRESLPLDLVPHWCAAGYRVLVFCTTETQAGRILHLLRERDTPGWVERVQVTVGALSQSFRWPAEKLVAVTDRALLGSSGRAAGVPAKTASSKSAARDWAGLKSLGGLSAGELVVHVEHGIGKYGGLVKLDHGDTPGEFLLIEYAENDKLYVPVYRLEQLQKYSSATESAAIDRLGGNRFANAKAKAREAVRTLAVDLVRLYAERKVRPGVAFPAPDVSFREFEAKFQYAETPGQILAIDAICADLSSGRIMDRLICGDVGFGKTEVAMRAAFLAVTAGKQVAVLVPTTLLAEQHERTFAARFQGYSIQIAGISRFKSPQRQKVTLAELASGKIDIIVGTHRLLSQDVRFQDLGLIIIDEEHRFGVDHKEKLKALRLDSHVLTLSATPIPRTLNMALSGLREISMITTPPNERLPIRTFIAKSEDSTIQKAVRQELYRGGQVFFVHNRVQTIEETANHLRELLPEAGVVVAHGQQAEAALSKAMGEFVSGRAQVLVCTSIIESGLDLPNANTLIVNRADAFGLAQLYQIRGRVGRSNVRAYAYLLIPGEARISDDAQKRLEVLQRFIELGSGFSIASHDLEIRGGGELLGPRQSGHIAAIGFDLYAEMLEDAIHEIKGEPISSQSSLIEPEIKLKLPAYFPETYIASAQQRLGLYRRLSAFRASGELDDFEIELRERFGPLPAPAAELLWLLRLKLLLRTWGIAVLTAGNGRVSLTPAASTQLSVDRMIRLFHEKPGVYQITPDSKFVTPADCSSVRQLYLGLESLLAHLSENH